LDFFVIRPWTVRIIRSRVALDGKMEVP
jgi:hypothetical protein